MMIDEFPTIRIDDFRVGENEPQPELCFLTHMHEDHTAGLSRKSYYGPIVHCSGATRALLLNFRTKSGAGELKYNHLRREICGKDLLRVIEFNTPTEFDLMSGKKILVTFIDANHCPGAAMILIQCRQAEGPAILFTGDLRCETWHLNALSHNPNLFPFFVESGGKRPISLYVDDTFAAHVDPYKEYEENYSGVANLVKLLKQYPEETHFCLADSVTGYEEVMINLAQQLNSRIHMSTYHYNLYQLASDYSPLAKRLLDHCTITLEGESDKTDSNDHSIAAAPVRLHFCQKNHSCPFRDPHSPMAYFKPCNQPPQSTLRLQNAIHDFRAVPQGILNPFEEDPRVFKGPDQRYFLCSKSSKFYPLFPWFYFSRHASFPELCRLMAMLHVSSVKSLAGTPLQILNSLLSQNASSKRKSEALNKDAEMPSKSSIASLITDGPLPLLPKKPRIETFQKRTELQRQRVLAKNRRERPSGSQSYNTSSEDEELCHNALMMLACESVQTAHTDKPSTEVQTEPRLESQNSDPPVHNKVHMKDHELSSSEGDSSTLPSPPASPGKHIEDNLPADSHGIEHSLKGEIPETQEESPFSHLVERLRDNPEYWFELELNCLASDQ